jgi:hypothetical protein
LNPVKFLLVDWIHGMGPVAHPESSGQKRSHQDGQFHKQDTQHGNIQQAKMSLSRVTDGSQCGKVEIASGPALLNGN